MPGRSRGSSAATGGVQNSTRCLPGEPEKVRKMCFHVTRIYYQYRSGDAGCEKPGPRQVGTEVARTQVNAGFWRGPNIQVKGLFSFFTRSTSSSEAHLIAVRSSDLILLEPSVFTNMKISSLV